MARSSMNLPLCVAGLIACLSTETVLAGGGLATNTVSNTKLYHERKTLQIEEVFSKLPSIENEVDSLFDDASFFSSFGASPQAPQKNSDEVEDLFRRILHSQQQDPEKVEGRNLSFLNNNLEESGAFGGDGVRNGGVRGSATSGVNVEMPSLPDSGIQMNDDFPISLPEGGIVGKIGKSGKYVKSMKSVKGIGGAYKNKEMKKGKRYKDDNGRTQGKLMKSTNSGNTETNFSYDPNDGDDDLYTVNDDFHFDNWGWEWEEQETPEQDQDNMAFEASFNDNSDGVAGLLSGVESIMGRVESITEEGQYEFETFVNQMDFSQMEGLVSPLTIQATKIGQYKFNFPTIQHKVYSGAIHMKAHSPLDLSPMDPDIFVILQSILTPYLQQTMGTALHSYNLEVDYSPGHDRNVGKYDVITLMEVKCAFKVVSDSIESFRSIDNMQASRWIHDFFAGPELYKFIEALQESIIPVNDIAFINQEFQNSLPVSEANSQNFGRIPASKKKTEKASDGAAMIGITLSVLTVGMIFFMHSTGRLPSKAQIGDFGHNVRDSIVGLSKKKRRRGSNNEGSKRRRRTFSGTFRRFPDCGLQRAALQKKAAKSEYYLGDSASEASVMIRSCKKSNSFSDMDDYSLSGYSGDYGPPTPSRQSSVPPMTPASRRTEDEFSMPDDYESAHDRGSETILGMFGKTAAYLMSPGRSDRQQQSPIKSPIPSSAPRRVTASDIASPNEVDNWSIQSYESQKEETPSNHPLYRGWNESGPEMRRPQLPEEKSSPEVQRSKLYLPFFS